MLERLLSFDANSDLRITRDELPERMQGLIARGDKNANAALDMDEIHALVNSASSERNEGFFQARTFDGLPGVVKDMKLPLEKHNRALAIVGVGRPVRSASDPLDGELKKAMRSLLDDEEYENFLAAAIRLSRTAGGAVGGAVGGIVRGAPGTPVAGFAGGIVVR